MESQVVDQVLQANPELKKIIEANPELKIVLPSMSRSGSNGRSQAGDTNGHSSMGAHSDNQMVSSFPFLLMLAAALYLMMLHSLATSLIHPASHSLVFHLSYLLDTHTLTYLLHSLTLNNIYTSCTYIYS